jgi:isopenicillin N synthase-like dioxygenase
MLNANIIKMEEINKSGFFFVPNDDIPIENFMKLVIKYFNQTEEMKNKNMIYKETGLGYSPITYGKLNDNELEYHETFSYRPNSINNFIYDNEFNKLYYKLRDKMDTIFIELIKSLGLSIENYKDSMSFSTLNINHYPFYGKEQLGIAEHSDWGFLTLLYTTTPGLQILINDEWIDIQPKEGYFIVNIGDMLEILSNGKYKSTKHRVITKQEKYSIILFYEPKLDFVVSPYEKSNTYNEIIYKDYFKSKLDKTYETKFKL